MHLNPMSKTLTIICTATILSSAPAMAQVEDSKIPQIEVSTIERSDIERPHIESKIETSVNIGFGLTDAIRIKDNDSQLTLDSVKLTTFGVSAEKKLLQEKDFNVSVALSGEAGFGVGSNFEINGASALGNTDYRRLQAYGDVIGRYAGGSETNWTPFAAVGAGVVEEQITQETIGDERQKFQSLTPKSRFRAGLEKKLTENVTFGISAGKTVDLD